MPSGNARPVEPCMASSGNAGAILCVTRSSSFPIPGFRSSLIGVVSCFLNVGINRFAHAARLCMRGSMSVGLHG
jgi:hypothetical protein